MPTPALAFLAGSGRFAAGIMVSASHNPADDNGLKVLDGHGLKLDDSVEDELEPLIWRSDELGGATNAGLGRIVVSPDLVDATGATGWRWRSRSGRPARASCSIAPTAPAPSSGPRSCRPPAPPWRSSMPSPTA